MNQVLLMFEESDCDEINLLLNEKIKLSACRFIIYSESGFILNKKREFDER